jgi:hypothetical protein
MNKIQMRHGYTKKVHFQSPVKGELTLCGWRWVNSDVDEGHSAGSSSNRRVTCEDC